MNIQENVRLAPYTSFKLGGPAKQFVEVHDTDELLDVLEQTDAKPIWLLGYGSNTLISDRGLDGLVICMRGGTVKVDGEYITADAGTWWDDVVVSAIDRGLWGTELMSEIPGSVGAALFINITAYGQSIGPITEWVEVWDQSTGSVRRLEKNELKWDYKCSIFQQSENARLIILRACFKLSKEPTHELIYQKAIDVASELSLDLNSLEQRRRIIIEARNRAGSLWNPKQKQSSNTVGSFFRNPIVSDELAQQVMNHDESGKTCDEIMKMNRVHGGSKKRVSAAHVMLAAGFYRGQSWGSVKLNDKNLLKIEAMDGATAQDVYNVAIRIQSSVEEKLGIHLEPEARLLGEFQS